MSEVLRPGLLSGVSVRLNSPGEELAKGLAALGAEIHALPGESSVSSGPHALVIDCSGWSAPVSARAGTDPLIGLLDDVWELTLAVAGDTFIPGGRGGRIVFIAPVDRDGLTAPAAGAALENLSRTLSVEWARHAITAVTLLPGPDTDPQHLVTVVAYLLSPAGAYISGTRLEMDALRR